MRRLRLSGRRGGLGGGGRGGSLVRLSWVLLAVFVSVMGMGVQSARLQAWELTVSPNLGYLLPSVERM